MVKMAGKDSDQQPLHRKDPTSDKPPKKKPCTGYCCYKLLVIIYSLLFVIIGICLFAIGIWLGKVKGEYDSINDTLTAPVILAVIVGLFMMIFAFMGLIGAIKEQIFLLKIFFAIAIIVFLGQVIIGILAFIYREESMNLVNRQLSFAIEKYESDDDVTRAVNHIQRKFKCCGLNGPGNWQKNQFYSCDSDDPEKACSVPDSCCKVYTEGCGLGLRNHTTTVKLEDVVFQKGCTTKFRIWMETHLDIVGATALGLSLLHVLGIFITYFFITAVQDRVWLFKYRKRYYDN